jgi:rare lipoprotein A
VLLLFGAIGCGATVVGTGTASWYGKELAGNRTASGEPFRPSKRTAAHRSLPFGTVVRVTRLDTGDKVKVVINDRGPYSGGRIIDVSESAAKKLDMIDRGLAKVELAVVGCRKSYGACD